MFKPEPLSYVWEKSNRSNNNGACVEVRAVGDQVQLRHSRVPDGPVIPFTHDEWDAFIGGVTDGQFRLTA